MSVITSVDSPSHWLTNPRRSPGSPEEPWSPYVEIEVTAAIESACPQPELIDLAGAP